MAPPSVVAPGGGATLPYLGNGSSPTTTSGPGAPLAATTSSTGASKSVAALLDNYQRSRLAFAQGIADAAAREAHLDHLAATRGTIVPLLRPLLLDQVVAVQQAAALALGRLANHSPSLAAHIVAGDVLPHIVYSLDSPNRFYKKSAAFVLRAVARHSPELAAHVVDAHAVDALGACLQDFDPGVKESAAWALGYIAKHTTELAQSIVDAGLVPSLVMCLQEPEVSLRRIAASALSDLSKHSAQLAQAVVDAGSIPPLVALIGSNDAKLKRQAVCALSQVARHSVDLAEAVVDADIFPRILLHFRDMDGAVRRQAAVLMCELAKHAPDLAQLLVNAGAVTALVDYLGEARGAVARVPAIMALGYVAAFSETLALAVVVAQGIPALMEVLSTEAEPTVKAACAWTLGQIGRHSPDHAKALAAHAVLPKLLALLTQPSNAGAQSASPPGSAGSGGRASSASPSKQRAAMMNMGGSGNGHAIDQTDDSVGATTSGSTGHGGGAMVGADAAAAEYTDATADMKLKAKRALKAILEKTLALDALDPLVKLRTPPNILKHVLAQLAKILPNDVASRRRFVTSGCCQRVQEIAAAYRGNAPEPDPAWTASKMAESIRQINACFPEEIVRYYSPGYSAQLLQKLDGYVSGAGNAPGTGDGDGMAAANGAMRGSRGSVDATTHAATVGSQSSLPMSGGGAEQSSAPGSAGAARETTGPGVFARHPWFLRRQPTILGPSLSSHAICYASTTLITCCNWSISMTAASTLAVTAPRPAAVAANGSGQVLPLLRLLVVLLPPSLLSTLPLGRSWDLVHYLFLELSVIALFRTLLGLPDPAQVLGVVPPPAPAVAARAVPPSATIQVVGGPAKAPRQRGPSAVHVEEEDVAPGTAVVVAAGEPQEEDVDLGPADDGAAAAGPVHPLLARVNPLIDKLMRMVAVMNDAQADAEAWELVVDRGDAVKVWRSRTNEHQYRLLGIFDAPLYTTFDFLNDIEARPGWDEMTDSTRILEHLSPTTRVQQIKIKAIWPTSARDLCVLSHWRRSSPTQLVACTTSVDHPDAPELPGVVRMWADCAGQICDRVVVNGIEKTRVLQIADGDPKGWVPKSVLTMVATKAMPNSFLKVNELVSKLPHVAKSRYFPDTDGAEASSSSAKPSSTASRKPAAAGAPPKSTPSATQTSNPSVNPPPPAPTTVTATHTTRVVVTPPRSWLERYPGPILRAVHRVVTAASPYAVSAMLVMMVVQRLRAGNGAAGSGILGMLPFGGSRR
ncbi:hypothetical protein H9P43_006216 [Blastocladiella emersonii ATCC 22665]|nr:hypothetical protein H9P43_006216 [Blastocladiella emersonii ATCC 22665]